jgi:hypothetical protein
MASTERSLGWATSGTGDGPGAGYDSTRWRANAQKSDGTGITLFGSLMAMSGATTSTLTIADGAAIINGYTYETNGAVTISTTGLTGTYSVVLVANNTAGTVTVTANGAGTTTIAASTIRAAIATAAQVTTITTAVGAANVITLGSTSIAAGVIGTITPAYPYSTSLQVPSQIYAVMDSLGGSVTAANTTATDLTGYSLSATSGEGLISVNTTTGVFTVVSAGLYHVEARCAWDANTTGSRMLAVNGTGFVYALDDDWPSDLATNIAYQGRQQISGIISLSAGATVKAYVLQNSGGNRTVSNASIKLVRF